MRHHVLYGLPLLAALLVCTPGVCAPSRSVGASPAAAGATVTTTVALLGAAGPGAPAGVIVASQSPAGLVLTPHLYGLPPGVHGFHLHTNPSCQSQGAEGKVGPGLAAGGHFDPAHTGHHRGPLGDGHKGDLPPLVVSASGVADMPVVAPHLTLADISGHALVIHGGGDNFSDTPAPLGGGGARIACGVVGQ